jgi:hypothetical protein
MAVVNTHSAGAPSDTINAPSPPMPSFSPDIQAAMKPLTQPLASPTAIRKPAPGGAERAMMAKHVKDPSSYRVKSFGNKKWVSRHACSNCPLRWEYLAQR